MFGAPAAEPSRWPKYADERHLGAACSCPRRPLEVQAEDRERQVEGNVASDGCPERPTCCPQLSQPQPVQSCVSQLLRRSARELEPVVLPV